MKKQYRVGDDLDVEGLISTLRKTDPSGIKNLEHRGGRLGGKAMANDKKRQNPNLCAGLNNAKEVHNNYR